MTLTETEVEQLRDVLNAARAHADNEAAWKGVPMPSYFQANVRRAEYRTRLRQAITALGDKASL